VIPSKAVSSADVIEARYMRACDLDQPIDRSRASGAHPRTRTGRIHSTGQTTTQSRIPSHTSLTMAFFSRLAPLRFIPSSNRSSTASMATHFSCTQLSSCRWQYNLWSPSRSLVSSSHIPRICSRAGTQAYDGLGSYMPPRRVLVRSLVHWRLNFQAGQLARKEQ
jgi:hypothetical protein